MVRLRKGRFAKISSAAVLESYGFTDTRDMALAVAMLKDFEELIPLAEKVIDQTTPKNSS